MNLPKNTLFVPFQSTKGPGVMFGSCMVGINIDQGSFKSLSSISLILSQSSTHPPNVLDGVRKITVDAVDDREPGDKTATAMRFPPGPV